MTSNDPTLYAITDADIIPTSASTRATSQQPDPSHAPDTLYQHMRRIDAAMSRQGRALKSIHISAAGYCQIEYSGQRAREIALLVPMGGDALAWLDQQIIDLHESGLVGPLCASYDEYECVSPHIRLDGTPLGPPHPQPGEIHGSYYVWPYHCQLPGCQVPLDTTGKPMAPIGSRHHKTWCRATDLHALTMGWVKRLATGRLACAGHPTGGNA